MVNCSVSKLIYAEDFKCYFCVDDRKMEEANTLTTRDIEALSWKLREASDADMHHSCILLPPNKSLKKNSSGGFLGLKTETQHPVPRTSPEINKDLNSQSASFAIGSETHPQAAKKKGEKKIRKPKYAFQTRSQVDILDDGYRWRKSYYRCTYQGCDVKKQVQRLTKDEGVVVTTYEGMHTHPIEKPNDNFEHILSQMQIYSTPF
ncbi:hypothetical protein POTOM_006093 [Populus tomentosa]|uniref:WRKY domain-containing protein n=1 Tax=Populus tomentosa TaxID=118781 RepID=A0A8X8AN85_POPTO|nr:hypothetical protein POTOM_006093 [Populus tomentosa]